jgi:hypothetical protein
LVAAVVLEWQRCGIHIFTTLALQLGDLYTSVDNAKLFSPLGYTKLYAALDREF